VEISEKEKAIEYVSGLAERIGTIGGWLIEAAEYFDEELARYLRGVGRELHFQKSAVLSVADAAKKKEVADGGSGNVPVGPKVDPSDNIG
jgi:hypothetical protein